MSDFNEFPDIEAVVSAALRDANLEDLGRRVYSSVPKEPTFPLAVVYRIGGIPAVRRYMDRANLQIAVWANSKSEAHDVAQRARVEIMRLEGTHFENDHVSAWVSAVDDSLGLTFQPDPDTAKDRYLFGVLVAARTTGRSSS